MRPLEEPDRDAPHVFDPEEVFARAWPGVETALAEGRRRGLHRSPGAHYQRAGLIAAALLLLAAAFWWLVHAGTDVEGASLVREVAAPDAARDAEAALATARIVAAGIDALEDTPALRVEIQRAATLGDRLEDSDFEIALGSADSPAHWPPGGVRVEALDSNGDPLLGADGLPIQFHQWLRDTATGLGRDPFAGVLPAGIGGLRIKFGWDSSAPSVEVGLAEFEDGVLEVPVPARHELRGRVIDAAQGGPVAGAAVRLVSAEQAAAWQSNQRVQLPTPVFLSDAAGEFEAIATADGEHVCVVFAPGYLPAQIPAVRPDLEAEIPAAIALEKGRVLRGTVRDRTGQAVPGVRLAWTARYPPELDLAANTLREFQWRPTVFTDSAGRFAIEGLAAATFENAEVTLAVLGRDLAAAAADPGAAWCTPDDLRFLPERAVGVWLDEDVPDRDYAGDGKVYRLDGSAPPEFDLTVDFAVVELAPEDSSGGGVPAVEIGIAARSLDSAPVRVEVPQGAASVRALATPFVALEVHARDAGGRLAGPVRLVADPDAAVRVAVPFSEATGTVQVELVDSDGIAVPDARFHSDHPLLRGRHFGALRLLPGGPPGSYQVVLPAGPQTLQFFGPAPAAGALSRHGLASQDVDVLPGDQLDLGRIEIPSGTAVRLLLPGMTGGDRTLFDNADLVKLRTSDPVELALSYAGGDFVPVRQVLGGDPAGNPPERAEDGFSELWTWLDDGAGNADAWRDFYLAERLHPGSWVLRYRVPDHSLDPGVEPPDQFLPFTAAGGESLKVIALRPAAD
ncbi:MAG TPA: carboxypeptidase-like regulatory domain-containing protein [Planctomycetota bacterium]